MLRIKKEIDLKELKKFGFVFDDCGNWLWGATHFWFKKMYINAGDRVIHIEKLNVDSTLNTIYDLIQSGYVEKVEE